MCLSSKVQIARKNVFFQSKLLFQSNDANESGTSPAGTAAGRRRSSNITEICTA